MDKNKMNLILTPPSLEHRALVMVAVTLCGQRNIRGSISNLHLLNFKEVLKMVDKNVLMLSIPSLLKEKLFAIIEPIILEIKSWMSFHMHRHEFVTELPTSTLLWTPHGTIDNKRTAALLVKDETIDAEKRFKLACIYCLVDDILDLKGKFKHLRTNVYDDVLTSFWSKYKKENELNYTLPIFSSPQYEILFRCLAVIDGNEVATRYFYHKLNPENADNLKMRAAVCVAERLHWHGINFPENQSSGILYFLLTIMNVEQQAVIFQKYTCEVLRSLLVWPRERLFLEVAKEKFQFLSKEDFYFLLRNIVGKMNCNRSYLTKIFLEFWQQSTETYKQFVTGGGGFGPLLLDLYRKEDKRSIKVILKDSSISVKNNLIFSDLGQDICNALVYSEKWDFIEYIIQECISSPREITEFKGLFTKNVTELRSGYTFAKNDQWNKFFQILENLIIYRKRKVMKDNNASSKKICFKNIQE